MTVGNSTEGRCCTGCRPGRGSRRPIELRRSAHAVPGALPDPLLVRPQADDDGRRGRRPAGHAREGRAGADAGAVRRTTSRPTARCATCTPGDAGRDPGADRATPPARRCGRWPSPTPSCRPTSRTTRTRSTHRRDELEHGLVFAGFVAIRDPLRDDVKDAVAQCRAAGIEVKMITGDNVETARAIGRDIGLLDSPDALVHDSTTSSTQLTDDELKAKLPHLRILARARPLDKYRMVKLLQDAEARRRGDRRRHQRRPGAEEGRRRPGDGHRRHRGRQGGEQDRPARRRVHHHRQGGPLGPVAVREHPALHPVPADDQRLRPDDRVPRAVPRRQAAVHGAATAVDQRHHGHVRVDRAVLRAAAARPDAACRPSGATRTS